MPLLSSTLCRQENNFETATPPQPAFPYHVADGAYLRTAGVFPCERAKELRGRLVAVWDELEVCDEQRADGDCVVVRAMKAGGQVGGVFEWPR